MIEKYTHIDRAAFNKDERTQIWVIHHQEIIGVAANHISDDL
jgi:uncharacterized protein with HEPN domain